MSLIGRMLAAARTRAPDPDVRFAGAPPMSAGVPLTQATALTLGAVFACVRAIAEDVAVLPWHGYRREGQNRTKVTDLDRLLNRQVNDELGAVQFRTALVAHALTWGNAYAEIERNLRGQAVALHLITPDRVTIDRDRAGLLIYKVTDPHGGGETILPARDVFHLRGLGWDGIRGYSPVSMAARDMGINLAQNTFAASFFGNGAHVGMAVEVPQQMSSEGIKALLQRLTSLVGGPRRAFTPIVLDGGSKLHRLSVPPNEAQFLESRQFAVEEIARWYRVPPHKIGHLARSTFSNIEHQGLDYVASALLPWVRRLEEEADRKLTFGWQAEFTKIALQALMRADSSTRGTWYQTMRNIGAFSVNDVRALEDMDGIGPDGDVYVMQQQYVPLDMLGNMPAPAPAPASPEPDDDAAEDSSPPTTTPPQE
jgi:HK97 family phage portal protein